MRMVIFGMVLMATIVATASLTFTTALTFTTPVASSAAMNPHEMMKKAGEMPLHVIVDAI